VKVADATQSQVVKQDSGLRSHFVRPSWLAVQIEYSGGFLKSAKLSE